MIWPFRIDRHTAMPDVDIDRERAREARAKAEQYLEDVRARNCEVSNAAKALRDIRVRNHLAELVGRALGENRR